MALVSPGLEITVTDESQYIPGAVGTVPLIIMATAQDKTNPSGAAATDTSASRAGKLLTYTSQRELITAMGYPSFKQSAAGTPLHGDERNEYGLMAAYSALGQVNRIYAIRADVDLDALEGTSVRPIGAVANGTHWLDLSESTWGIYEWSSVTNTLSLKSPLLVVSDTNLEVVGGLNAPLSSVGKINDYAVVIPASSVDSSVLYYYKDRTNTWRLVGSPDWQNSLATLVCAPTTAITNADAAWIPASTPAAEITINTVAVTIGSTVSARSLNQVIAAINSAGITGVTAGNVNNILEIYVDQTAESDGATADGKIDISSTGGGSPLGPTYLNITAGVYARPILQYGTFASMPNWRNTDSVPRPTGSVFVKNGATGNGSNVAWKKYNSLLGTWDSLTSTYHDFLFNTIYALDPAGGGNGIPAGTLVNIINWYQDETAVMKTFVRSSAGQTVRTGNTVTSFVPGEQLEIIVTRLGTAALRITNITLSGSTNTPEEFVADVLAANIPELEVSLENNKITFKHIYGGEIYLTNLSGTPVQRAGFPLTGTLIDGTFVYDNSLVLSNFEPLTYTFSSTEPYEAPEDGTLWYYSDPASVDIMINEIGGWKGYKSAYYDGSTSDARGFDLSQTDPNGVIITASEPEFQSDGVSALVAGDLWLDTGDLENYPVIYRYDGAEWALIDNTDQVSQNGIVFADARWDTDGTTDIINGALPSITDLLASDYIDQDAPDYRLYPRGMLLFNLRRSGYNVKRFVSNKFNANAYPDLPAVPGADSVLPTVKDTWQTASGLKNNGSPYMGRQAQRRMVTAAMQAALVSSTEIREEQFAFNLISCPGYPETIDEMVALNNDRKNTAFIVGDTPMRLAPNSVDIINWSNNTNGDGLATADPYLGVWYPSGLSTDLQGNDIVVPPSHIALRTLIRNDNVAFPWFAPAGARRGLVDNASSIGYIDSATGEFTFNSIRQGLRDTLYENRINPITNLPGIGLVIWGQKTRNPFASSLDRINVARLVNYIRTILARVGDGFLFEPNDEITRNQIKNIINTSINDLVAKRGIYDYVVICDESNNTPARIARSELYVDIAIEPMKAVEFIYIPIRLKNPGDIAAGV